MRNTVIHGDWGQRSRFNALMAPKNDSVATRKSNNSVKANEIMNIARRFASHHEALEDLWIDAFYSHKAKRVK